MDQYGIRRNKGYQLSLDNFEEKATLSGLDELVNKIVSNSDIGYNFDENLEISIGYYITSDYDINDISGKLKGLDSLQLGYLHNSLSDGLRREELSSKLDSIDSTVFLGRVDKHLMKKEEYEKAQKMEFQTPLLVIDFENNRMYGLERTFYRALPVYSIKEISTRSPFADVYIKEGKAHAVNHYYSFSAAGKSKKEADACWNIFTAKPV